MDRMVEIRRFPVAQPGLSKLFLKVKMDPFTYNHEFKPNHSFGDVAGVNMVQISLKNILVSTIFIFLLFKQNIFKCGTDFIIIYGRV